MLNRPPQGAQCDINYAVMWLELHIHELCLSFSHVTWNSFYEASIMVLFDGHKIFV